ncbi:unnamed protein product [Calypogeia fissa]
MSAPSSPSPSSGSDDFAALLDADLLQASSPEELAELPNGGSEEDVDIEAEEEEGTEQVQEFGAEAADGGEDSLVEEEHEEENGAKEEEEEADDESENLKFSAQLGEDVPEGEQYNGQEQAGRGKRKREQEEDVAQPHSCEQDICPPHPGFMWGVCIRCGENRQVSNSEPEPAAVSLRYIHEGLEVSETEAARMRRDELKHVMHKQKLYLVLDLDHTMLNSARFIEVLPEEEAHLAACYSTGGVLGEGDPGYINGLHRLNHLQMWTKLRPFAHEFIEAASKICEMYVYTMGERAYAVAMVRLLDPTGRFFGDRIISQGDSTRSTMKDLDVVLGAESAVVILDDTEGVWPKHRANLVLMERYHFFRSSCRQFGVRGLSLTEKGRDESEKEGALAMALQRLRRVHDAVFSAANPIERGISKKTTENVDIRNVIQSLKGKVLNGCQVVFSRIFPIGMPYPEGHAFWRLTAELGAHCSTVTNSSTTHVIALDRGTDKARWAKQNGKFLVHPSWVEAANYLWSRPAEEDFPVGETDSPPPVTSFAMTVPVMRQRRPETPTNGGVEGSHIQLPEEVETTATNVSSEIKHSPKEEEIEVLDPPVLSNNLCTPPPART